MIVDKLLTRRGWRVVAHAMLAGSGIGFLCLLSRMILAGIRCRLVNLTEFRLPTPWREDKGTLNLVFYWTNVPMYCSPLICAGIFTH